VRYHEDARANAPPPGSSVGFASLDTLLVLDVSEVVPTPDRHDDASSLAHRGAAALGDDGDDDSGGGGDGDDQ
jgi:hypothetical protein